MILDLFNEILDCFRAVVDMYFNDLVFTQGVTVGWIILAITCFSIVISFMLGRMK